MFKFALPVALGLLALAPSVFANPPAPGSSAEPELRRSRDVGETDKPARAPRVVLPGDGSASGGGGGSGGGGSGGGGGAEEPPIEPPVPEPPVEEEEPPTFFGEPVKGNFVWVLDRSGSMQIADSGSGPIEDWNGNVISQPSRMTVMKSECVKVISRLKADDKFAIVTFGDNPEWTWFNALVAANDGNKAAATNFIINMQANGWTPAYTALKKGCTLYGTDLDKFFFLSDGSPNYDSGAPGGYGGPSAILSAFPGWYSSLKINGCDLVCIHMGSDMGAGAFMQDLANQNGGTYIKK